MSYRIEYTQAVRSHYVDLTAAQWLLLLALLGRNNALLLAKWECLHIERGRIVLIQDVVKNILCQCVYLALDCLATTEALWGTVRPFNT